MELDGFGFDRLRTINNEIDLMNYEVMMKQCRLCLDDNPYFSSILRKEPSADDVRSSFAFLANNLDFGLQKWCEKCKQKLGTLLYGMIHLSNTEKIFHRLQKSAKEYHQAEARKKIQQETDKQESMKVLRSESVYKAAFRKLQEQTAVEETIDCGGESVEQQPPASATVRRKRVYKGKDIQKLKAEEKRYSERNNEFAGMWESNLICNDKQKDVCGVVLRRSTRSIGKDNNSTVSSSPSASSSSLARLSRRRKSMFVSKVRRDCRIQKRRKTEDGVQTTDKRRRQTKNICICCEHTTPSSRKKPRKKVAANKSENSQRVNVEEIFHIDGIDFYEYIPSEDEWQPEEDLDVIWTIGYSSTSASAKHKRRYSSLEDDHTYHKSPVAGDECFK